MTDSMIESEKRESIEANGLSIGYSTRGSGPPLVLVHGAEAGREMFDALAPHLAAYFTVIAYDQRDTGSTRDLALPPRNYGLAEAGDDVAALIEALGHDKAHVFGTSLGGNIAQVFAARHPERLDRLILSSTFLAGHSLRSINPGTAEQVARRAGLMGVPYPLAKGEIAARTLLLMTDEDALIPRAATLAVAEILRDPVIQVIPGVGHIAAIQAPAELARRVVAFLAT